MKDLIERSYTAIRKRGLITSDTDMSNFLTKMKEELDEINDDYYLKNDRIFEEVTDLMTVCIMALYHHGFDPVAEFEKTVQKNETRKD